MKSYTETVNFLYTRLPMFSRVGASAIKKDLTNTLALCEALDNPHKKIKCIHVAGTNGKGSVSHMLAATLQKAGYKTGLYTSPHLKDFRERIKINGKLIPESEVVSFTERILPMIDELSPSFFEITVGMAFDYFSRENVDVAIIEVGLGGRLDSTNVILPELSIITNIGLDHVNLLGDTLPQIAFEKAGIIKENVPAIIGQHHPLTDQVFIDKAQDVSCSLTFAEDLIQPLIPGRSNNESVELEIINYNTYNLPQRIVLDLSGAYQKKNVTTVLAALVQLRQLGYAISNDAVSSALSAVKEITGLMGRWQTIGTHPLTICDTGHNEDGIKEVLKSISNTTYKHLHIVIGMVKDKDISKILSMLPPEASYYFCNPDIERAKPANELAGEAASFELHGDYFPSVRDALLAAKQRADIEDLIFVGGSTFVVAEVV